MLFPTDSEDRLLANLKSGKPSLCAYVFSHPNLVEVAGLAGMGDLIATCVSPQSRNRHVGEQLGKGRTLSEIIEEMTMVAEGVKTCRVVIELAERYGIEMPIAREVYAAVHEGSPARDAYRGLTRREAGAEHEPG